MNCIELSPFFHCGGGGGGVGWGGFKIVELILKTLLQDLCSTGKKQDWLRPVEKISVEWFNFESIFVVYFDQREGTLHTIHWLM